MPAAEEKNHSDTQTAEFGNCLRFHFGGAPHNNAFERRRRNSSDALTVFIAGKRPALESKFQIVPVYVERCHK